LDASQENGGEVQVSTLEFVLLERRKPAYPAFLKIGRGLAWAGAGAAAAAALSLVVAGRADEPVRWVVGVIGVACAIAGLSVGVPAVLDGVTDFLVWRRVQRGPGPAMRLSHNGVEYSKAFRGDFEVRVPWDEVTGCEFRPGFGGGPVFCIDAPGRFPDPPPQSGCAPDADPETVTTLALIWAAAHLRQPLAAIPRIEAAMLVDVYMFGTPLAINLDLCDDLDRAALGQALGGWTGGRCDCLAS
jgi:hypothetical protein